MNNKIYMTLANMYQQIKGVIGSDDRSLSDEINERIANSEEVIEARGSFDSIEDRLNTMESTTQSVNAYVSSVDQQATINKETIKIVGTELEVLKNTTPIVELDDGNKMLVQLEQRPHHRTLYAELSPGEKYRTNVTMEHFINQVYVSSDVTNYEHLMYYDETAIYDIERSVIEYGSLVGLYNGPTNINMSRAVMSGDLDNNRATIPGIAEVHGFNYGPCTTHNDHVLSAFKKGYVWSTKYKSAEMIVEFLNPIYIHEVYVHFRANSNSQKMTIEYYDKESSTYILLDEQDSLVGKLEVRREVERLKIYFDAQTNNVNTLIQVSNISLTTRKYFNESGTTSIMQEIDSYSLSGNATFDLKDTIPDYSYVRYGIDSPIEDECYVYSPVTKVLTGNEFRDVTGGYNIGDLMAATEKSLLLDYTYKGKNIIEGENVEPLIGYKLWSDKQSVSANYGLHLGTTSYLCLRLMVGGNEEVIPLDSDMFGVYKDVIVNDQTITVGVKNDADGIRITAHSEIEIQKATCEIMSIQCLYDDTYTNAVRPSDKCSTSVVVNEEIPYTYPLTVVIDATIGHYSWTNHWLWGWDWRLQSTSSSKYNTTEYFSVTGVDDEKILANPMKTGSHHSKTHDYNYFYIENVNRATFHIAASQFGSYDNFTEHGTVKESNEIKEVSALNEFTTSFTKSSEQKISNIWVSQEVVRQGDIEYFLSNNNYTYYVYQETTNTWILSVKGMTQDDLERIPSYALERLITNNEIYLKVRINTKDAVMKTFNMRYNKNAFFTIPIASLKTHGMTPTDFKSIDSSEIMDIIDKTGSITVLAEAYLKHPYWRYILPGIELVQYGGVKWSQSLDNIANTYISENSFVIENISSVSQSFRIDQKYFDDKAVTISSVDEDSRFNKLEADIDVVEEATAVNGIKADILDQNIKLLESYVKTIKNTSSDYWHGFSDEVSDEDLEFEIPSYSIPTNVEIDLPILAPGSSTGIDNIKEIRYIQFWDTQEYPIVESLILESANKNWRYFSQTHGRFQADHYEIDKYYDIDNAYHLSESVTLSQPFLFETADYICTSRCSSGINRYPRHNKSIAEILTGDASASTSSWHASGWAATRFNLVYNMPGEDARWMDFDFEFKEEIYLHGIFQFDVAGSTENPDDHTYHSITAFTWQITTIFLDYDGSDDWHEHETLVGLKSDGKVYINKAIKKLRIRIEVPYSHNRGEAMVALKHLDFYYCPVRYRHDEKANIRPLAYAPTSTWDRLLSVHSEAEILGVDADIHYFIETNTEGGFNRKYWSLVDGELQEVLNDDYETGMLLQELNTLTEEQLKVILNEDYVRLVAILFSEDGHHTPKLKTLEWHYSEINGSTTTLLDQGDIMTRYDKENQRVLVTNTTNTNKKLKAIIS